MLSVCRRRVDFLGHLTYVLFNVSSMCIIQIGVLLVLVVLMMILKTCRCFKYSRHLLNHVESFLTLISIRKYMPPLEIQGCIDHLHLILQALDFECDIFQNSTVNTKVGLTLPFCSHLSRPIWIFPMANQSFPIGKTIVHSAIYFCLYPHSGWL